MSSAQFTPGPWTVDEDNLVCAGTAAIANVYSSDDFPCLEADDDDHAQKLQAEFAANARLIAAAPDMHADLSAAPILSDFNTARGFNRAKFVEAYQAWKRGVARTLTQVAGQGGAP